MLGRPWRVWSSPGSIQRSESGSDFGCGPPQHPSRWAGSADAAWAAYELAQSSHRHRTPAFSKTHPLVSVLGVRGEVHLMLGHQCHLPLEHPYERHAGLPACTR
jgi:hypothetical protein